MTNFTWPIGTFSESPTTGSVLEDQVVQLRRTMETLQAENVQLRGNLSLAEEGLANYAQENERLRKLTEWQPIATAPKGVDALFCVVPRTAGDDYFVDTSGFPIFSPPRSPRVVLSKLDCGWSSLEKAILWLPLQPLPQPGEPAK